MSKYELRENTEKKCYEIKVTHKNCGEVLTGIRCSYDELRRLIHYANIGVRAERHFQQMCFGSVTDEKDPGAAAENVCYHTFTDVMDQDEAEEPVVLGAGRDH